MTTPRGKAPQTASTPNGRKAGASRPKASSTQKIAKPGTKPQQDFADTAAQLAAGAEAAPRPGTLAGLGPGEAIGALRFLGQQAVQEPLTLLRDTPGAARELLKIALGKSQVAPEKGDKRFADPAQPGHGHKDQAGCTPRRSCRHRPGKRGKYVIERRLPYGDVVYVDPRHVEHPDDLGDQPGTRDHRNVQPAVSG
jgi:hypothetical protein